MTVDLNGLNDHIDAFVCSAQDRRLKAGTGYYSALFRGGLFGLTRTAEVVRQLKNRRVDVLWLGANPNVPMSLANIIGPSAGPGDYPSFERQRDSGLFASWRWDDLGQPSRDFSPIERPRGGWLLYTQVLKTVEDFGALAIDHVAMANLIPWGSANAPALLRGIAAMNPALLARVLDFADALNTEVVRILEPRLLIVPLSLGREWPTGARKRLGMTLDQATDPEQHQVRLTSRVFNFHSAICKRGSRTIRALYLPHPAALRLSRADRMRVQAELSDFLARALSSPA